MGGGGEDLGAAGMDGPALDVGEFEIAGSEPALAPGFELLLDEGGEFGGKGHFEAVVADAPGHGVAAVGEVEAFGVEEFPVGGGFVFGELRDGSAEDGGGGAISKEGVGDKFVGGPAVGEVEGAEFDAADEDEGIGIGEDDGARGGEGIEGSVTTHEADVEALDIGREGEAMDEFDIEAGGGKAGAGDGDEVGDGVGGDLGFGEGAVGGGGGEGRGVEGVLDHAGGGGGAAVGVGGRMGIEGAELLDGVAIGGDEDAAAGGDTAAGEDAFEPGATFFGSAGKFFGECGDAVL